MMGPVAQLWSSMVLWAAITGVVVGCAGEPSGAASLPEGPLARSTEAQADGGLASLSSLPWPRRLALEQAMAARSPRYAPRQSRQIVWLTSPGAGAMEIDERGARLDVGVTIALAALGRHGAMRPVGEPQIGVRGPMVERRLGRGVVEWWRALPSGLEQGVTIIRRPPGTGALLLDVLLAGLEAKGAGAALTLCDASGAVQAHYGHLWVTDATGAEVPARLSATTHGLRIEVHDQDAVYPLVVDPLVWAEAAHLFASDGSPGDWFGSSVSISADGNRALVGARGDETAAGALAGSAYIFARSGATWTEEAHLLAPEGAVFGYSVSLSADGTHALVGAAGDRSAHMFARSGATWTEEARLFASDGVRNDAFGHSVSVSADGSRALVGARDDDTAAGFRAGSAYIFARSGGTWAEEAHLFASDGAVVDHFGHSVSLSANGIRAVVGAHSHDTVRGTGAGSAYIFTRSGAIWTEEAALSASDGGFNHGFGIAVSLSADGSRALIGAGFAGGSAYMFARSGATWTEEARLIASPGGWHDGFGMSVSLSADGSRALVGAHLDDVLSWRTIPDVGGAYLFARYGAIWTQEAHLRASDGETNDGFGRWVSLSADGSRALIGAVSDDTAGGTSSGSAYVFELSDCPVAACSTDNPCEIGAIDCTTGMPVCIAAGPAPATTLCRAAAHACDLPERCDGVSTDCPVDERMAGCDAGADARADAAPDASVRGGGCCAVAAGAEDGRIADTWLLGGLLALVALRRLRRRR